jgi:hypothetical protein
MTYHATKAHVTNRGVPPDRFLDELVAWGKTAPNEIFAPSSAKDIYFKVAHALGPFGGSGHRRAVMLEVMRVLAGFESSWKWNDGRDITNPKSVKPETTEAGAWQVSADSLGSGQDLKLLVLAKAGSLDPNVFQRAMKHDHALAMEYIARLLRHNVRHNGPVRGNRIQAWLRQDAVMEFLDLLHPGPQFQTHTMDNICIRPRLVRW